MRPARPAPGRAPRGRWRNTSGPFALDAFWVWGVVADGLIVERPWYIVYRIESDSPRVVALLDGRRGRESVPLVPLVRS